MRDQRFTILCNEEERQALKDLAERLARSQGDTVRYLIRRASHGDPLRDRADAQRPAESRVAVPA